MKITTPIALASMLFVLAGCGGGSEPVTEPDPESSSAAAPTEEPDSEGLTEDQLVAYFEQVFSGTGERQEEAEPLTAKGSPAARYLAYQSASSSSAVDSGTVFDASDVSAIEGGVEVCYNGADCFELTDVKTQNGRVSNFKVDGDPFEDRVTGGGKRQNVAEDASVQLVGALRSADSDALYVGLNVATGDTGLDLVSTAYQASYREASGRQIKVNEAQVGTDLQPSSSATIQLSFPGADLGGSVILDIIDSEGYSEGEPAVIQVPTP